MDPIDRSLIPTIHDLGRARAEGSDEARALRAFDAYFLGELLKRSAPENPSGLFDGGQAGRMYRDHLYDELARMRPDSPLAPKALFQSARVLRDYANQGADATVAAAIAPAAGAGIALVAFAPGAAVGAWTARARGRPAASRRHRPGSGARGHPGLARAPGGARAPA